VIVELGLHAHQPPDDLGNLRLHGSIHAGHHGAGDDGIKAAEERRISWITAAIACQT
jgi:hypothetical protein